MLQSHSNECSKIKPSRKESQYGREEAERNGYAAGEAGQDRGRAGQVRGTIQGVYQHRADGLLSARQTEVQPVIAWEPGAIIAPKKGTVAYDGAQTVESYNVSCFVIQDTTWEAYWAGGKKTPPAFASGGQVYLRPTIPDNDRGKVAPRELTHVMKQAGYQPYLDFVNRTLKQLDQKSVYMQQMLTGVANQKGIFLKAKMDRDDIVNWYDEFHASIYGEIAANTTGKSR